MMDNKNNLLQIKLDIYAIEGLKQDLITNMALLNEIMYSTTTVINPIAIAHKQSFSDSN